MLKPVNPDRLTKALDRIGKQEKDSFSSKKKLGIEDSVFLKLDNKYRFLEVKTILKVESAADYTMVFLRDGTKMLTLKTLKEWEFRLPEQMFCRIHRSTIIIFLFINNIEPWFNHSYMVYLKDCEKPVAMSRRYFSTIKKRMG